MFLPVSKSAFLHPTNSTMLLHLTPLQTGSTMAQLRCLDGESARLCELLPPSEPGPFHSIPPLCSTSTRSPYVIAVLNEGRIRERLVAMMTRKASDIVLSSLPYLGWPSKAPTGSVYVLLLQ